MPDLDLNAITERYHRALNAKPGKGPISEAGIASITDSVCDIPDLLAALAGQQPTAQPESAIKAEAWNEGWAARASRAHLKVGECVPAPAHINPYRADRSGASNG